MPSITSNLSLALQHPRIDILKSIGDGYTTPKEIAHKLGMSMAHINQQLHLLCAQGIITKRTLREGRVGKPSSEYTITHNYIVFLTLTPTGVSLRKLRITRNNTFQISAIMMEDENDRYILSKFYYHHEELIRASAAVGVLSTSEKSIDLFMITDEVEKVRKHHSKTLVTHPEGGGKEVVIWSHTPQEVQQGLERKEQYFIDKVLKAQTLWESHEEYVLVELKKKARGER